MTRRFIGSIGMFAAVAVALTVTSVPALTQSRTTSAPPLVVTAFGSETPKTRYVAPKTPWGEPDLQGVWSTDDTSGIPMARPAQYGDRLYLNQEEFTARAK